MGIMAILQLPTHAAERTGRLQIEDQFPEGERFYREGSYQKAYEEYQKTARDANTPEEQRWVQFRLAETRARAAAATRQADDSAAREAQVGLEKFVEENQPVDRVWAEAHEALGDVTWQLPHRRIWERSWPHYEQALGYWAGSTNLTYAAERYWSLVRKAAEPKQVEPFYHYGTYGNFIPVQVLENALKISRNEDERARAHFMIAMTLRSTGGGEWEQRFRVPHEFEAALKLKKDTGWYDDALYYYGEWMSQQGAGVQDEQGNWMFEPEYTKALELFQRLTSEFKEGESRWLQPAKNKIREITQPALDIRVSTVFLPESEIEYFVTWRNVESAEFTLYKTDMTKSITLRGERTASHDWVQGFDPASGTKVKSWKWTPKNQRPYKPGSETIRMEEKLPMGAYLLIATGNGLESRELILVSDIAIVTQIAGTQVLTYVCEADNGSPVKDATVRLWERTFDGKRWQWVSHDKTTGEDGIALEELNARDNTHRELVVLARAGDRQAFSIAYSGGGPTEELSWKVYATSDRPAYRPGEKVNWKVVARRQRGETYAVPSEETIVMRITDPRGGEVRKEKLKLNNYGSAWGEFTLSGDPALGPYTVVFLDEKERRGIGSAPFFRVEEYKLPEYRVTVKTPEEKDGRKKTFLLGEPVEVEIGADYYFGGPVANATVEVVVRQNHFYHYWTEPREFQWLFQRDDIPQMGGGQVVQRETLTTDAEGKAKLTIQTRLNQENDLEYQVEARVTDASRREVVGTDSVRVSRQRFYVHPKPRHRIYKPQDKVEIEFRAVDANNQPVVAEGKVRVTRDYWYEIWVSPEGREVKGDELKQLRAAGVFPPLPQPGRPGWRLKFQGYQHDEIKLETLKTGTNGLATLSFTPEREGYYRANWRSDENLQPGAGKIPGRPVRAETAVWVGTSKSVELGYRPGFVEIVADKESFRAGEKTPVMLTVPDNDRYVLFTVTGKDLIDYHLVHLEGSVKLLELEIDEKHVPNAFLNAATVAGHSMHQDSEEIIVPPTKNFLTVEVVPDREQYQPGDKGSLAVTTLDHDGKPVSAEVALGLVDESIYYIQEDYAVDSRQFFYGTKRQSILVSGSSFNTRAYSKLLPKEQELEGLGLMRDEVRLGRAFKTTGTRAEFFSGESRLLSAAMPAAAPMEVDASMDVAGAAVLRGQMATLGEGALRGGAGETPESPVQVRTDFRSAIFWQPDIKTDEQGKAKLEVTYPDSLTSWRATARAVTTGNQFGMATAATRTKQPLIVRLQAPRFFLTGDSVTVSAVINNNTEEELSVSPTLEVVGMDVPRQQARPIKIAAGVEGRADWVLHPTKPGEAKLKVTGRSSKYADAMERGYTVYEHGIEKFIATSGKGRGNEVLATLNLPAERKEGSTRFTIQVTPSMAVTMLDALPYLVNYPYGCTEQTMSRFLPATITAKTLKDLGLKPADVLGRAFGGIEGGNKKADAEKNLEKLNDVTEKGLQRLYDFQHGDGGWGWWKEGDSDLFMTAYVVWGLTLARDAGIEIKAESLNRAADYLNNQLVQAEQSPDLQTWMLHALAVKAAADKKAISEFQLKAFENLWMSRDQLNAYTKALFALSAHHFGKAEQARTLIRNLENGVKMDEAPGRSVLTPGRTAARSDSSVATAHWGEDGMPWRWSEGGVEATAFALRALLAIDPEHKLVEPVANWLIKNRRGAQWSNTRDTAIVLLALNDYLRVTKEIEADLEYEVVVNGTSIGSKKVKGAEVFNAPERFTVPQSAIRNGNNEIRIVRKAGKSPVYFAAESEYFSLEEPIPAAGNEVFVKRQYFRLQPVPTLLKGFTYEKVEVRSGDEVESGERIETVLTIESKNNYEYLVFEDLKPAGLEAVDVRSGQGIYARRVRASSVTAATGSPGVEPEDNQRENYTGETRRVYQELRDRKVALFLDKLPEGFWEIRYEARAEVPGEFHALPVLAHAMYVPEIRGNSAEGGLKVIEAGGEKK